MIRAITIQPAVPGPVVVPVRGVKAKRSRDERRYSLTRPCAHCPFRTDVPPYIRRECAREIVQSLVRGEFSCHETTISVEDDDGDARMIDGPRSLHCAGALIMLEHAEAPSQMMRIMERIGAYDPRRLDMKAPVFRTPQAFIDAQHEHKHKHEHEHEVEHDPCHCSDGGCEWPAGMMMGASAVACEGPPEQLDECSECGEPTCDSCMRDGVCSICREDEEG